eukprot:CAMPEP_0170333168 /NCGR_PEP_ID=MMETSP0116_2-20130129/67601_1 /TAXON_ID=400756 /ORGANISM="Durinskia baltica, Strain CSIRO CS-38" /LENGTH=41 /DNA_ID= /DNA_START= /DNA_END= /DNA_ORIENTATION=
MSSESEASSWTTLCRAVNCAMAPSLVRATAWSWAMTSLNDR